MNYQTTQFKEWLANQPNHASLPNWEEVYQQLGSEFTEESLNNLTAYPQQQAIIKEWINSLANAEESSSKMIGAFPSEEPKKIKALEKQVKALTILANKRKKELEQEKKALITLAKRKLANKKEAQQLLNELEKNWAKEKKELLEEKERNEKIIQLKNRTIGSLQAKLNEKETQQGTPTNQQETITILRQRNEALQRQAEVQNQELTRLTDWNNTLKEQLRERDEELEALQTDHALLVSENQTLQAQMADLNEFLNQSSTRNNLPDWWERNKQLLLLVGGGIIVAYLLAKD